MVLNLHSRLYISSDLCGPHVNSRLFFIVAFVVLVIFVVAVVVLLVVVVAVVFSASILSGDNGFCTKVAVPAVAGESFFGSEDCYISQAKSVPLCV